MTESLHTQLVSVLNAADIHPALSEDEIDSYPYVTFELPVEYVYNKDGAYKIVGNLTIRSVSDDFDQADGLRDGIETGFLLNDESMWTGYRWDTSSYAICAGSLDYWTLTGHDRAPIAVVEAPEPTEEPEESAAPTEAPEETPVPTGEPEESPEPLTPQ